MFINKKEIGFIILVSFFVLVLSWLAEEDFDPMSCVVSEEVKTVRGSSMTPVVSSGTEVTLLTGYYDCNLPQREEVVVLNHANNETPILKIIKGLPGDKFHIAEVGEKYVLEINNQVVVNSVGKAYGFVGDKSKILKLYEKDYKGTIPPDAYLVLGDNTASSWDSIDFGLVSKRSLIGKVIVD